MSVNAGATRRGLPGPHWPEWANRRRLLVAGVLAAIALGSQAASAVTQTGAPLAPGSPIAQAQAEAAAQASIKRAATTLAIRYKGEPQTLVRLGQTALREGRNDATVADFLRLRWIGRLNTALERYGPMLDAPGIDQLALGAAGAQHYSELIHNALLRDGPAQLVVVSLFGQRLIAYDHGRTVLDTLVTTGRPALPTDVGGMAVWKKDSPWTMQSPWPKGSPDWYPDTQVQMVVWFARNGEGLHDASWQPAGTYGPGSQNGPFASHGCIHVPPAAETVLYNWAAIGTPVVIIPGDGSPLVTQAAQQTVDAMGNPISGQRGD